jgi:hypothetical protein
VKAVPASATTPFEVPPAVVVETVLVAAKPVLTKPAPATERPHAIPAPAAPTPSAESIAAAMAPPFPGPAPAAAPTAPAAVAAAPPPEAGGRLSGASALLGGGAAASGPVAAPRKGGTSADRGAVERAIAAYSAALESRSAAEVRRVVPSLPEAQHAYLASLFGAGGRMQPRWKTSDIVIRGDTGTARVRGTTRVVSGGGNPYDETVDARVTLERTDGEWRIRSFQSR